VGERKPRAPIDRRQHERRHRLDRRQLRIDTLQAELEPLQSSVRENADKLFALENEQKIQLVRISQIQQELDELKKSRIPQAATPLGD
jgi:hypothetical protein